MLGGHKGHGFQFSGLDFSSFRGAPFAAGHAATVVFSSCYSSPCASVCMCVACPEAHGSSVSPV